MIPSNVDHDGSLIAFPKIKSDTTSEIINTFQKIFYKIFSNEKGLNFLSSRKNKFYFHDFKPLVFLGRKNFSLQPSAKLRF